MRMNEVSYEGGVPVDGYGPGFFRVQDNLINGPVLVAPDGVTHWAGLSDPAQLVALRGQVDVLFIGVGAEIAHLPADLRSALEADEIPFEVMVTGAAARTYNVLLSEGRRVAVAMIPV